MAAIPVIINGVLVPKTKEAGAKPIPAVFLGLAGFAGLEPTHPIVLPPEAPVEPPVVDPPPVEEPPADLAVVIKPAPSTGGWGLAANDKKMQWFFVPGESGAGPKRR